MIFFVIGIIIAMILFARTDAISNRKIKPENSDQLPKRQVEE